MHTNAGSSSTRILPHIVGSDPAHRRPEHVSEYKLPSALLIHEAIRADGEESLARPWSSFFWSGVAAGMSMGLSVIAAAAIHGSLPPARWNVPLISIGTTIGYLVIILGRQGLITESTMVSALDVLSRPRGARFGKFSGVIALVSVANIAGALLVALVLTTTAVLEAHTRDALTASTRWTIRVPRTPLRASCTNHGLIAAG